MQNTPAFSRNLQGTKVGPGRAPNLLKYSAAFRCIAQSLKQFEGKFARTLLNVVCSPSVVVGLLGWYHVPPGWL